MRTFQLLLLLVIVVQSCTEQASDEPEDYQINLGSEAVILVDTKDSLSISGVKAIPFDVFRRNELKYLSIFGQDCDMAGIECFAISEIPKEISKLKKLEELHLKLNYITTLPIEILELKNLRVLDINENPGFDDIEKVEQMTWLEEFSCYGCQISDKDRERLIQKLPNCKIGIE